MAQVFDALKDAGEVGKKHPFSDVDAKRDIFDFPTLLVTEFDERRKEGRGQVIDAEIADVLEAFQRVRLAGSRKTGNHHELESWHVGPSGINQDDVTGL